MLQRAWSCVQMAEDRPKAVSPAWGQLGLLFLSGDGARARAAAGLVHAITRGQLAVAAAGFDAVDELGVDAGLVAVIRAPGEPAPLLLHEGGRVEWTVAEGDVARLHGHIRELLAGLGVAATHVAQPFPMPVRRDGAGGQA